MHPLTVYEIAVREHQHATAERSRARQVRSRLRTSPAARHRSPRGRLHHREAVAPTTASEGRPAVA